MEHLWKDALQEHYEDIVKSADHDDVFLDNMLDHMLSKRCIQSEQKELIKSEKSSCKRCRKFLDFLQSEDRSAFDELCNALETFGTESKTHLANLLKKSLIEKQESECRTYNGMPTLFTHAHTQKLGLFYTFMRMQKM